MSKIDIDKFIEHLVKFGVLDGNAVQSALFAQGLILSNYKIQKIGENSPMQEEVEKKQESEDEKIRKELIDYINRLTVTPNNIDRYNSWIAWLEKQGEMSKLLEDKDKLIKELGKYKVKYTQETLEKALTTNNIDDERLRKNTIAFLKDWLEKQGEKEEPQVYDTGDGDIITYSETDGYKVEPKLKIERGKWYVCIKNLLDDYGNRAFCKGDVYLSEKDEYLIPCNSNVPWMIAYCVDTYFKEWTIQDAKDGDVLSNGKMIVIFKHFEEPSYRQRIVAYIGLDNNGDIQITDDTWTLGIDKAKPATKEQRDLLFQKMKEDGYEWDAEKKELKKISNVLEECEIAHIEHGKYYYCIKDYYAGGNKRASKGDVVQALNGMSMMALGVKANEYFIPVNNIKQKSSWSVEDSSKVQRICQYLDEAKKYYADITEVRECVEWLKSLEDRVQPKPTEWSDEDEENLQNCCGAIGAADYYTYDDKQEMEKWLLQLKERLS